MIRSRSASGGGSHRLRACETRGCIPASTPPPAAAAAGRAPDGSVGSHRSRRRVSSARASLAALPDSRTAARLGAIVVQPVSVGCPGQLRRALARNVARARGTHDASPLAQSPGEAFTLAAAGDDAGPIGIRLCAGAVSVGITTLRETLPLLTRRGDSRGCRKMRAVLRTSDAKTAVAAAAVAAASFGTRFPSRTALSSRTNIVTRLGGGIRE